MRAFSVPDASVYYCNRGNALKKLGRLDDALASYDQAIKLRLDYANAYCNRGVTLHALRRLDDALASFDQAIKLRPDNAEAFNNRGLTLQELKRPDLALASYDQAIKLKPGYANAHSNRGVTLQQLDRLEEALASYHEAIKLKPDHGFLYGTWLHAKMKLCDWSALEIQIVELLAKVEQGLQATPPFAVLAITGSLALQRKAAEIAVTERHPASPLSPPIPKRARQKRVRIGYYSADYHDHPTAFLMAELFELHDRNKFELVAFSFGPDREDEMRRRVSAAFDRFIDVRDKSDHDTAMLSRDVDVDIAVDLKGFTQGHRAGIFSHRAAPIQVSYLGYPGTMGARYIDYLIADRTLVSEDCKQHYAEKIVFLPDSYQVNDRQRKISDRVFSHCELGLPQQGFVFCCFNNNFKVTPATFDGWMRILKQVDGSVLWLFEDNPAASRNLRKEAEARGVSAGRLVFAGRMPLAEHLARHRAADLFVDTLPCNAHTTASDALWTGLPVLTCIGEAFSSRVAASLLNAIDLPELVTTSQEQYEALAVELATNSKRLGQIKRKLERNRLTTPLFDTQLFTTHIEDAYMQMYERYQTDLPTQHIYVASEPSRRTNHG